jgi:hypothetical protein
MARHINFKRESNQVEQNSKHSSLISLLQFFPVLPPLHFVTAQFPTTSLEKSYKVKQMFSKLLCLVESKLSYRLGANLKHSC